MFDSLNKAPGRTDCKEKKLNSVRCTNAEKKSRKTPKNDHFSKNDHLGRFLNFFSNDTSKKGEVFCVAISAII